MYLSCRSSARFGKRLIDEDLDFITCDRLTLAEEGSMSGLHGFSNWMLHSMQGLHLDTESKIRNLNMGFRKSISEMKMRPTNDGMPLSEEMKILARRVLGKKKAIEISVPYRPRVGEAEIILGRRLEKRNSSGQRDSV